MKLRSALLALIGAAVTAACDIPTDVPIIEQRWILPASDTDISVEELLPDGVTAGDGVFLMEVAPVTVVEDLGELCSACAANNGNTVPKPAFDDTVRVVTALPSDVAGAQLASGSVTVRIENGFNFDPLRPAPGVTGTMLVRIRDVESQVVLGEFTLDGTTESLPAQSEVTRTITLNSVHVGASLRTTVAVNSPAGDPVTIDTSEPLTVTATPTGMTISSATVNVSGKELSIDEIDLDVGDIDTSIADRIKSGGFVLDVTNPFGVGLDARLDINHLDGVITKNTSISSAATSSTSVAYTAEEFRSFLGKDGVTLAGSGTIALGTPPIEVTPDEKVTISAKLDVTLQIGG